MFEQFFQNKFVRNVILVASGTAAAQIISILFAPVITRIYSPEAFGLLATFTAILSIAIPVAALTYPFAVVLPKTDVEAKGIIKLCISTSFLLASFFMILLIFFGGYLSSFLGIQDLTSFIYLIPVAMFFSVLKQSMEQWLIRKKLFKITAKVAITQSLYVNVTKVALGLLLPFGFVLVVIQVLSNALYATQLWISSKNTFKDKEKENDKEIIKITHLAFKYKDFAIHRAPQTIVNAISQSLPVLLLSNLFGAAVVGYYSLSYTMLIAPAILIGSSIGNVFYSKVAETVNVGKNPLSLLRKVTYATFMIGLIPFGFIMLLGEQVFSIIFGEEWKEAGIYAEWMAIWILFYLASRPLTATIPTVKLQGVFLMHELIFFIFKLLSLVVGGFMLNSPYYAVISYSLITAISYLFLYFVVFFHIKKQLVNKLNPEGDTYAS